MDNILRERIINLLKIIRNEKIIDNTFNSIDGTKIPQVQYLLKRKDYIK